jgi:hypothetical protein
MRIVETDPAAEFIGRRPSWLRHAAQKKLIPHFKVGRALRFCVEDLQDWLLKHRVPEREARTGKVQRTRRVKRAA